MSKNKMLQYAACTMHPVIYLILISHNNEILGVFDSQMKASVVLINFRAQSNVSSNNNVPILIWISLVHSFQGSSHSRFRLYF